MTTFATSTTAKHKTPGPYMGYQLCEFCISTGEPQSNPESVCECKPIHRTLSGSTEIDQFDEYDTIVQLAETAMIEHWTISETIEIRVKQSIIRGAAGDTHIVEILFDGRLCDNLTEPYETDIGTAEIHSFSSNGSLTIGVDLADE